MVKIYMTSATILYKNLTWQAFRAYVNSANGRGGSCITAFKDQALTQEVQIQLQNVEYFEPLDPVANPITDVTFNDTPPIDPAPIT